MQIVEYLKTDTPESMYMAGSKWLLFRRYSSIDFKSWNWIKGLHQQSDEEFSDNVKYVLFELGYSRIEKTKNGVYFIRQTKRNRYEQGIFFALNNAAIKLDQDDNPYKEISSIDTSWYYFNSVNDFSSTMF